MGIGLSIINIYMKIRLPLCIDIACFAFLFYLAGRKLYAIWRRYTNVYLTLITMLIGFAIGELNQYFIEITHLYSNSHVDMLYMNYGLFPLFLTSATMISFAFMSLTEAFYKSYKSSFVEHIGRISLLIMVIHLYILQIVGHLFKNISIPHKSFLVFLCTIFISILLSIIVEKCFPILYKYPNRSNK